MSKELLEIGAQKIHEDTHIPKQQVQSLLHKNFDKMTPLQFSGFIQILEKKYLLDLTELKEEGIKEITESVNSDSKIKTNSLKTDSVKFDVTYLYIIIALIVVLFTYLFSAQTPEEEPLKNTIPKVKELHVEKNITKIVEINSTIDTNITSVTPLVENNITEEIASVEIIEEKIVEEVITPKSLFIKPLSKVWLGFIDIKTNKKRNKSFKNRVEFDTKKDWLLLFGHGRVNIEVDGEIVKFREPRTLRLKYVDGVLTKITTAEFKKLNRGRKW